MLLAFYNGLQVVRVRHASSSHARCVSDNHGTYEAIRLVQHLCKLLYTSVPEKEATFYDNCGKYGLILIIRSQFYFGMNCTKSWCKTYRFSLNMLPHYLVKVECSFDCTNVLHIRIICIALEVNFGLR